ncbi:GNAT family N-acetyltransferase [Halalkalibacter hemicellulosilyticus]|uniref:Acetyltransferase n=1 Tax=Halalkalibacter hemicellulosilyticusJCM 9152 TaxID=1236971 RepID=W4QMQ2_9BACI|nr:GNAT family N-acetyltransferase [Halalkalibacter hemicellulosilyticus]GAE32624.1 acetyltransferase [Halalkalibacter hemicellulosilyticusJCM 9152]
MQELVEIKEVNHIDNKILNDLTHLLIDVVNEGASIGFLPPISEGEAEAYWKGVLKQGIILWVAKINEEVCGAVQLHFTDKENGLHRAEVAKLMVNSNHRRKGIGKKLMNVLHEKAKSHRIKLLVLDTRLGDPSNKLYKSIGYYKVGEIPKYAKSSTGELDATVFYYKEL